MNSLLKYKEEVIKLSLFFGVGVLATLVHLSVAGLVLLINKETYPIHANIIAFAFAFPVSFFGHKYITFKSKSNPNKFLVVAIINFILNNGALLAIIEISNISGYLSIILATFSTPAVTYVLSRLWAFK